MFHFSKGKLRLSALLMALVLALSLFSAGCSKKQKEEAAEGGTGGKAYKIGVNTWGSGVPILDLFGDEAEYALKTFGCTTTRMSDDFTSDKELQNIQNMCSAGVDGICMQGAAVSTVPQMAKVCMDAKVPFVLYTFIGDDATREDLAANNPYYVGAVDLDMVYDGKVVAEMAYNDGCRTAVIIGGNIGDNNMDQRSQGFTEQFEAMGGKVLAEARCTDASECPAKAEDMLSANKDADCIYAMVGDYIPGSLSAIENLKLSGKIKVYMSCVDKASAQYIKEGKIVAGNDGICLSSSIAPTLLINYLDGHPILDENGKAPRLQTMPFIVNKDNADEYMSVFCTEGVHPLTEEVLKSLCWRYNPDVTYQTYLDFIKNDLNLNALLKDHGLPEVK